MAVFQVTLVCAFVMSGNSNGFRDLNYRPIEDDTKGLPKPNQMDFLLILVLIEYFSIYFYH